MSEEIYMRGMKILISSRSFGKIDSGAVQLLEKHGLEVNLNPYGKKLVQYFYQHCLSFLIYSK